MEDKEIGRILKHKYYMAHREGTLAKQKAYRDANRERLIIEKREYRLKKRLERAHREVESNAEPS